MTPPDALVARAARDKTNAGPPRLLAPGFRHHRGAALVAADGDGDAAVMQRIQHRQIGFAGHAEDAADRWMRSWSTSTCATVRVVA
jgi:hypothetical protein